MPCLPLVDNGRHGTDGYLGPSPILITFKYDFTFLPLMKVIFKDSKYQIESASSKGRFYTIIPEEPFCDCPHFLYRLRASGGGECKHIKAVKEHITKHGEIKEENQCDEILTFVIEKGEIDSIDLIEMFNEKDVNTLIDRGELSENKGMIKVIK